MDETVNGTVVVDFVAAPVTRPLRLEVLRPHRGAQAAVYPGDDDPRAGHVAATEAGTVLAVGSVLPEAPAWAPEGWRVRGMATRREHRGRGLGTRVLDLLLGHAAAGGGGIVWCNARTSALGLYRRAGFEGRGEVFEVPEIGPHLVMWRTMAATGGAPSPPAATPP
ncbi:MAG TPA: GNAT family N-acetyltransferase [Acidimicrobiales bacterium]|nr:GNAT family N-acetyltransferase [Acidimicrobiales bacterium]